MDTAYNENKLGSLLVAGTTSLYLGHGGHRAHKGAEILLPVQVRVHATFGKEGDVPVAQVVADWDAHYKWKGRVSRPCGIRLACGNSIHLRIVAWYFVILT